ncbi:MAG TPA: YjgP/YjgQ family permease [Bacteroidetes bacterium]|nr:YjgP/YjgQ family permease [Bacteroidota bacterium]
MILTRYILKEHVAPFLFSLVVIIFIFLLNIVFRDLGRILSRGIGILTIFEFLFLNLAWIIALAVPMGVLIATLTVFGRLSADNEITAIKASGISFYRLLFPVLIAGFIFMIGLIIYNNRVLPNFNHRASLLMGDIFRKRPTLKLEPNVVFTEIPHLNLLTKTIIEEGDSSLLKQITIDDLSDKKVRRTIFAKTGKLKFDKIADRLFLDLYNGEIHEINIEDYAKYQILRFERYRITMDIPGLSLKRSNSSYRGDREKSVAMMEADIANNRASIKNRKKQLASLIQRYMRDAFVVKLFDKAVSSDSPTGPDMAFKPTQAEYRALHKRIENMRSQIEVEKRIISGFYKSIDKFRVEIHKKYSIPAACIVFVLIGAPLGMFTKKGNMGVAAAIGFVFFMIYWVFLIGGEELADRQIISPVLSMWAPNIIVGIFGIYLVLLTVREYRAIRWQKFNIFKKRRFYE